MRLVGTYLAVVAVDVWLLFVLLDAQMDRGIVPDVVSGTRRFISSAVVAVPVVAAGLIPALVLSMELAARTPPPSRAGRALAGALAWFAWSAILVLAGSSLSGLIFFQASVVAGLGVLGISGAAFAVLGLDRATRPPGRGLIVLALAVVGLIIAISLIAAGKWGSPA